MTPNKGMNTQESHSFQSKCFDKSNLRRKLTEAKKDALVENTTPANTMEILIKQLFYSGLLDIKWLYDLTIWPSYEEEQKQAESKFRLKYFETFYWLVY